MTAPESDYRQKLKTGQIIVLAMMGGLVSFGAVLAVLSQVGELGSAKLDATIPLGVVAALAVTEVPVYVLIRKGLIAKGREKLAGRRSAMGEPLLGEAMDVFLIMTIIGAAMCEGVGLFGLVVMLLTGNYFGALFAFVALALLALQLPTEARLRSFASALTEPEMR